MPSAGGLRERITIEAKTLVTDAGGGGAATWSTVATVSAQVTPVKGREGEDAGRLAAMQTFLVVIRYRNDVGPLNRIQWRGRTLNIRSAEDREERRQWLTMECEEGVQNG